MRLVIKIGGSILYKNGQLQLSLVKKWINVISELKNQGHYIGIVVGGGSPARIYSSIAADLGASKDYQDIIGIESARQNARILIAGLKNAYPYPPQNYNELVNACTSNKTVIIGGFQPGQSTNAVAALFAEHINAEILINASNISKVYDKDPKTNMNAKPYDKLTFEEFGNIISSINQQPGDYALFDLLGYQIIRRSNIPLIFFDGKNPKYVFDILKGKNVGTVIK